MRRARRIAIQVGLSALLIVAVLWQVSLHELSKAITALSVGWFLAALGVNLVAVLVLTERWRVLLRARGRLEPAFGWLLETTLVSLLLGQVLPTAVGGDAVRAIDLSRRTGARAEAISSVLVDKIVGTGALVALAAAGAAAGGAGFGGDTVLLVEIGVGLVCAGSLAILFSHRAQRAIRPLRPLLRKLRIEGPARALYDALHAYRDHPGTLLWVFVLACLAQLLRVITVALLVHGMRLDVSFGTLLLLCPVLFLVTLVPISLNGVGLREATFVVVLASVGVARADAFVLGLAFFAVGVVTALLGGVVLIRRSLAARHPDVATTDGSPTL
ncbi:MAG: lysylphosphatidylglycerol synthase transmembrane domain-containing protein [Gaiellales bacterium]